MKGEEKESDETLLEYRKIFLWGDIEEEVAEQVVKSLKICASNSKEDIYLYIHSAGGDVDCCEAIIDEMQGCIKNGINVYTIAIGKAYSSACIILALGTPGCRFATNLCSLMLHPVSCELPDAFIHHQERSTNFINRKSDELLKMVANACGKKTNAKIAEFKSEIDKILWLTPKDAKKHGIIDGIWDYSWE